MNAITPDTEFFAPVSSGIFDSLFAEYQSERKKIEEVATVMTGRGGALSYFLEGNFHGERIPYRVAEDLFTSTGAIARLNAIFWQKAINITDVMDCMPQKRRGEWDEMIRTMKTPEFEADSVRATLMDLLAMRHKFLAERVDGIFRALSREHVTNRPEGFYKRMILSNVLNDFSGVNSTQCGHINDLRSVVAKLMGRNEELPHNGSNRVVMAALRNRGEWMPLDGGALRIRVYMKGTAHLEVHPNIAYQLNRILSFLHPSAIPSQFQEKPKKQVKEFQMMKRPLPFAVLDIISSLHADRYKATSYSFGHYYTTKDNKAACREALSIITAIGGVVQGRDIVFDYDPRSVLDEIITSGCIPDQKSHQFYPTPEALALEAVVMAEIGETDRCLEPSAGIGGIADHLPKERTTCVEISPLHCKVLEVKGFETVQADFLTWARQTSERFDKIIMNPPFSEGRAKAHVEAAASILADGGRLVAIMPASFRNRNFLGDDWDEGFSPVYENAFAGTSVDVVIFSAERKA